MSFYGASPIGFESVSAVTSTPSVDLGSRRVVAGDEYVYCYNITGSSVTQGALMVASGGSGFSLTRSSTDSLDAPSVIVANAAVGAGQYFWGMARGRAYAMSGAFSAGDPITVGTDGAIATFITATLPTGSIIGKVLVASTANAQPYCLLRLYG